MYGINGAFLVLALTTYELLNNNIGLHFRSTSGPVLAEHDRHPWWSRPPTRLQPLLGHSPALSLVLLESPGFPIHTAIAWNGLVSSEFEII